MMRKIVQKEDGVLRQNAKDIPVREITTPKIQKIIKEMSTALKSQDDGVAIAAPQIGYSLKIFVVSGKIFDPSFGKETEIKNPDKEKLLRESEFSQRQSAVKDMVFINPKISKLSREKEWVPEGCLSVRWLYGNVFRSKKAMITAYDEKGKKFTRGASGLLAQIFQHETDHLNGVLFIDKAEGVKEELPR